jgi:hypothetical protein
MRYLVHISYASDGGRAMSIQESTGLRRARRPLASEQESAALELAGRGVGWTQRLDFKMKPQLPITPLLPASRAFAQVPEPAAVIPSLTPDFSEHQKS